MFRHLLQNIAKIIKKHLHFLHVSDELRSVVSTRPMVSVAAGCKLSSCLVRAKLYRLTLS